MDAGDETEGRSRRSVTGQINAWRIEDRTHCIREACCFCLAAESFPTQDGGGHFGFTTGYSHFDVLVGVFLHGINVGLLLRLVVGSSCRLSDFETLAGECFSGSTSRDIAADVL